MEEKPRVDPLRGLALTAEWLPGPTPGPRWGVWGNRLRRCRRVPHLEVLAQSRKHRVASWLAMALQDLQWTDCSLLCVGASRR